ncbi:DNA-binding Lrp family transcriptional regulator [Epilithonimonas hungarica]|uniref:hypothetical protein n=1 Tax=Epilithonimonas hungarica TaxID=454006 RepID=UPI00278B7D51|nr:hypothetical protein [Epilithonimonas hungarica]MDP9954738.1 DNA-binding Lrp family transcriptional regulator [Epilithonimonas hungarica]
MNTNSRIAHEGIKPFKEDLQSKIYDALEKIESGSFRDIAKASGLRDEQVWKRLSEMEKENRIENIGTKLCEISHRPVSIWHIKPH